MVILCGRGVGGLSSIMWPVPEFVLKVWESVTRLVRIHFKDLKNNIAKVVALAFPLISFENIAHILCLFCAL